MALKPEKREPAPHIQCAHDGCPNPAVVYRRVSGSMVRLCKSHDSFHVQQESDEFVREIGLKSVAEKRAWCAKMLRAPKPSPTEHWQKVLQTHGLSPIAYRMARDFLGREETERQPGQDDEERIA